MFSSARKIFISSNDNAYTLHLIRQDCQLPPGTHVGGYCRDSVGEEEILSVLCVNKMGCRTADE